MAGHPRGTDILPDGGSDTRNLQGPQLMTSSNFLLEEENWVFAPS